MRHSELIAEIAKSLATAQTEYTPVPKNKTAKIRGKNNTEYTYKYADLADVLGMAVPILAKHGIAFLQPNERIDGKLFVTTMLIHESGQWMQSDGIEVDEMEMKWNEYEKKSVLERCDPRTIGGDFTYYRRYDGCSFIGIAPDEDVDAANNGPLPNSRGKNTTEAKESRGARSHQENASRPTSTQQSNQQANQRAAVPQEAAQPQAGQVKFIEPNGITCTVRSIKEIEGVPAKDADGDIPAMKAIRARMIVTILGQHHGVSELSTFDTKLFPALKESTGLECHFVISEKTNPAGKLFVNIDDILFIDGQGYHKGKPVIEGDEQ